MFKCPEKNIYALKHRSTKRLSVYVIDKLSAERSFSSVASETNLSVSTVIRKFDMIGFIQPKTLPKVPATDEFKGNTGKKRYQCIFGKLYGLLKESGNQNKRGMAKKKDYYLKTLREHLQNEHFTSLCTL